MDGAILMSLLSTTDTRLLYADQEVFSQVNVEIPDDASIGIVGPNGSGKTSLLRILTGDLAPSFGHVYRMRDLRIGYVPQQALSDQSGRTIREEILSAFVHIQQVEKDIEDAEAVLEAEISDGGDFTSSQIYSSLVEQYEALGGYSYENIADRIASEIGLDEKTLDTPLLSASGGERTRASLAKALLSNPDLLILDEPTNYLDFSALDWLESMLVRWKGASLVVSHDRYFLDRVAKQIWDVENQRVQSYPGNYTKYSLLKDERMQREKKEYDAQQKRIAHEESFIQRYSAGQRGREARGRATKLARVERVEQVQERDNLAIGAIRTSRTGEIVFSTNNLRVGLDLPGGTIELLSMPDIKLARGSRVAVVGSNGSGKTTLLRTLLGENDPLEGSIKIGYNVESGYYRQDLANLPDRGTVLDALLEAKNILIGEARQYLARFLFQGEDVFKSVESLSGGEKSRLALARLLILEPNFLVLDEPTTHLDIPSREALEQNLLNYTGTMLFVSHDRHLISLLADQIWNVQDGVLMTFEGTFQDWENRDKRIATTIPKAKKTNAKKNDRSRTKKEPPKPWLEDLENQIAVLEKRIKIIERDIATASDSQNGSEVAKLGEEYNQLQIEIAEALEKWADA